MTDRREWEHATAESRLQAIAADAELRRRHPSQRIEPLRSAEPAPASDTQREHPHPAPDRPPAKTASRIRDLVMRHQASRAELNESPPLMTPGDDPTRSDPGKIFSGRQAYSQGAILQPPKPEIIPSERILQLASEHDTEPGHEAGD